MDVKSVHKQFIVGDQKFGALVDIHLQVENGEFLAIAGSSGSGKTTLLNLIGGLDQPSSGAVYIDGRNLKECTDDELSEFRREKIGFIFQTFNLLPVLTALENVEYPLLRRSNFSSKERVQMATQALERVGLSQQLKKYPNQMSGGQRQRIAIARALVHKPSLIIADEPTANLDKKTGREILDLMRQLNQQEKVTFLFSTHDPEIIQMADRVVSISDGQLLSDTGRGRGQVR